MMAQTYFASIQPGLEEALLAEVRRVGGKRPRLMHGGVSFDAARKTLYAAHLQLRTPTRIWLRLDEFRARDAPELYRKSRRFGWERLIGAEHKVAVRAYSHESSLYHSDKIRDAILGALNDRFREDRGGETAPTLVEDEAEADQLILARIAENRCQLSLDASGDLLHRRGWRLEAGEAPLRESIAAAMLEILRWEPSQSIVDPFCGSATILIEAATVATKRPPGADRSFAFQKWRNFDPPRYSAIKQELLKAVDDHSAPKFMGRDRDGSVLELARKNAERAGVSAHLDLISSELSQAGLTDLPVAPDWIITNPPYGRRLARDNALDLLLNAWRPLRTTTHLGFLWSRDGRDAVTQRDKTLNLAASFDNGGFPVDLWSSAPHRK